MRYSLLIDPLSKTHRAWCAIERKVIGINVIDYIPGRKFEGNVSGMGHAVILWLVRPVVNQLAAFDMLYHLAANPFGQPIAGIVVEKHELAIRIRRVGINIRRKRNTQIVQPVHTGSAKTYL